MRSRFGMFLLLSGFLAIAALTLVPAPEQAAAAETTPLWCLVCGDYGGVDVLNNILLFLPFGAGLRLNGLRVRGIVATGALLSLTVEALQLLVIPGRDASLSDLLTNTLGTWLGAAVVRRQSALLKPTISGATRLALAGGLIWIAVQAVSGLLLRPWVPQSPLYGAWGRAIPGRDRFDGRITSASVSGIAIPAGGTALGPELASLLRQGQVRVQLGLVSGTKHGSWAPVLEVRSSVRTVLALESLGRDLVFEAPARSQLLRLRRP
ncbi:MAG TPA: VanZ family protein, partial [Actinomycetota bacterium]|nr:VanZ family protein [Actinomycetota bacterium]